MQKQIENKKTDNVIRVNFRGDKEQHPVMAELSGSRSDTEMTIAYYWEKKEYAKAAMLAQEAHHKVRDIICNDGIMHYHRLLSHLRRDRDNDFQSRHISMGTVYRELAMLHGTKGNHGAAESYKLLSKAALDRATGKA